MTLDDTRPSAGPRESVAGPDGRRRAVPRGVRVLYRPFRLAPAALILLLAATIMSREQQRLIQVGFAVVGICFVAGAALQLLTHHPLF